MTKPRKMWKLINDLSKNKIRDKTGPQKLETDTGTITDPKEICESLNSYFSTILSKSNPTKKPKKPSPNSNK